MWRPEYLYLREIRDAISRIVALIDGVQLSADLEDDWVKADALAWNFDPWRGGGEAAGGISYRSPGNHLASPHRFAQSSCARVLVNRRRYPGDDGTQRSS